MKKILCCLFVIMCSSSLYAQQSIFIVIHGTWSSDKDWHLPGGDFFDELDKSAAKINAIVIPYNWSGKLSHTSRKQAAKGLVRIIQSYPTDTEIYLVAHSHGGNVAVVASQLLGKDRHNNHKIHALFTLGTPVDTDKYFPDMDIIEHVYNFFSCKDGIQQVFGLFDREYLDHERIANVRVTIDDKDPGHTNLHHPVVARWLPLFPHELAQQQINGFQFFCCANPGVIHFYSNTTPRYQLDFRMMALRTLAPRLFHNAI